MKIYTKSGDEGSTGLLGGQRVSKSDVRVKAYGTVDELNSLLGFAAVLVSSENLKKKLLIIQHDLFSIGANLATSTGRAMQGKRKKMEVPVERVGEIETWIDEMSAKLPELKAFVLPGGTQPAAVLHMCRTVCRRAERVVVEASEQVEIDPQAIVYLNRLSDLLFVWARLENFQQGGSEVLWLK
jgi:cob(I)alamin adenosyltransferase